MLNDFFRINLPYGIAKDKEGNWMAFNREYLPIGFNNEDYKLHPGSSYKEFPVYTKYKGVTESLLKRVAHSEDGIRRNLEGKIITVFLYNDGSNPMNRNDEKDYYFEMYFKRIKLLSKLERADNV